MRKPRPIRGKAGQQGYALVLVVFLLAIAVITLATVTPNILLNGRREKEQQMIWRGKQYVRGIRLFVRYYQMHGGQTKFPTSMEDLTKNKVGIRFMRQEYKDPVNTKDGTWRFIYVGPNGQLIGSTKQRPLGSVTLGGGGSSGGFGSLFGNSGQSGLTGAGQNSSFGNSSFGNSSFGNSSFRNSQANNNTALPQTTGTAGQPPAAGDNTTPGTATDTPATDDPMSTPQAIAAADVTTVIVGGNIIGVGSKVNQKSIVWYDKAKNYRQFEFVWDPSKEPVNGGANAGVVGIPGQNNSLFGAPGNSPGITPPPGTITGNPGFSQDPGQAGQNPPSPSPQPQ
jgi:hypothetical protein